MVKGLPSIDHPNLLCEWCLLGKQFKKGFLQEVSTKAMETLQLVHSDICGPINPPSFVKKR
jgi:hypothetical protein